MQNATTVNICAYRLIQLYQYSYFLVRVIREKHFEASNDLAHATVELPRNVNRDVSPNHEDLKF